MKLIRVGRRRINLEHLIMDEEYDESPEPTRLGCGDVRITMTRGREFILTGKDAECYRYYVEREVLPRPRARADRHPDLADVAPDSGHESFPVVGEAGARGEPDGTDAG